MTKNELQFCRDCSCYAMIAVSRVDSEELEQSGDREKDLDAFVKAHLGNTLDSTWPEDRADIEVPRPRRRRDDIAAVPEEMIPTSFEPMKARSQTGRVTVTGGQESIAVGRPHITNQAFAQALVASIKKFQTFSNVIEDQGSGEEYLL